MMSNSPLLFTRRSALKRGLWGGLVLALAGTGVLSLRKGRRRALPKDGLRVLDASEYDTFCSLAQRIAPCRAPGLFAEEVARRADRILAEAVPGVQRDIKQLLAVFESALANFLLGLRTAPFSKLGPEQQDRILGEWRDSRILVRKTGYQALRRLVLAAYYTAPESWPEVAYPGPPAGFHDPHAPVYLGGQRTHQR